MDSFVKLKWLSSWLSFWLSQTKPGLMAIWAHALHQREEIEVLWACHAQREVQHYPPYYTRQDCRTTGIGSGEELAGYEIFGNGFGKAPDPSSGPPFPKYKSLWWSQISIGEETKEEEAPGRLWLQDLKFHFNTAGVLSNGLMDCFPTIRKARRTSSSNHSRLKKHYEKANRPILSPKLSSLFIDETLYLRRNHN